MYSTNSWSTVKEKTMPNPHRRMIKWCPGGAWLGRAACAVSGGPVIRGFSRTQEEGSRDSGRRGGSGWRQPLPRLEEAAGALKSKIYQQLATLSKLGWTGKDFTFTFIYKCAVWNSYSKVLLLSLLKNHLFPHGWTFWNVKSKSGTQRVHFKENSGHCRAHNAACIRFPTLKINEEPRKNFT